MTKRHKAELYDWFSLFCIVIFAVYLVLLYKSDSGIAWLNITLFVVTVFFGILFVIKITFLNNKPDIETSRRINTSYKAVKYLLKLLLLAVIVEGVIAAIKLDHRVVSVVTGTIISNLFFFIFLIVDTFILVRAGRNDKSS